MLKKIQNYLLTTYPLIWNTRIVWMIPIALILHIFYFLAGYGEVTLHNITRYSSILGIGGFSMILFSILCCISIIIIWLVFYLRNNAYKSFYIIDRFHSTKEYTAIIVIVFSILTFSESYHLGSSLKLRVLTPREEFVREVNVVNRAMAFLPTSQSDYFILNRCEKTDHRNFDKAYPDSINVSYTDTSNPFVKIALKNPEAFSYKNFCEAQLDFAEYKHYSGYKQWQVLNKRLIDAGNRDSIKVLLDQFVSICKKYHVDQEMDTRALADLVFKDPGHNVDLLIRTHRPYENDDQQVSGQSYYNSTDYFQQYELHSVLGLIEQSHLNQRGSDDRLEVLFAKLYFVLCFSILLFSYRLYPKKVFLFSILGMLLWSIIFGLVASGLEGDGLGVLYIILFFVFLILGILWLRSNESKRMSGILFNWHIYFLPFLLVIIMYLLIDQFNDSMAPYSHYKNPALYLEMARSHPVGYWLSQHEELVVRLNLLFVFLYTAFIFTSLSRKWHIKAEE